MRMYIPIPKITVKDPCHALDWYEPCTDELCEGSWYPDATDLADQNFGAIKAASRQLQTETSAQSQLQKWVDSGVHFDDLVSLSVFLDAPSSVSSSSSSSSQEPTAAVVGAKDTREDCSAADCSTCDKCQDACLSVVWCLPCWGM